MKNIILICLLMICSALGYGQKKYYTLKQCQNDTLKYIEKNYQDNKERYVGKTIGFWADECEIKLKEFVPSRYSPWGTKKELLGMIEEFTFYIYHEEYGNKYRYDIYIFIDETTPRSYDEQDKLSGEYDDVWEPKFYNFFKDAKIKKIYVGKRVNGKKPENYEKYRRP